jgi:uncharacterized membrane protein
MRSLVLLAGVGLLGACDGGDQASNASPPAAAKTDRAENAPAAAPAASVARWNLQSSGEGTGLALLDGGGNTIMRLFCASGKNRLLVNVPAFRPIGSEERMSFGSGGEVVALVADPRGDPRRGGVSGTGEIPARLSLLIAGPLSVSYGAQTSGPHASPPRDSARSFVAACRPQAAAAPPQQPSAAVSPCLVQGTERLRVKPLRAVGTEPFWGARIEGRCVTYSTPENQQGTRVWTRYVPGPGGSGTWSGSLAGKTFELNTIDRPGCSDGMSDKRYPLAVELTVEGEKRRGCAAAA